MIIYKTDLVDDMQKNKKPKQFSIAIKTVFFILTLLFCQYSYANQPKLPIADYSELSLMGTTTIESVIDPLNVKAKDGKVYFLAGLNYPDLDPYNPGQLSVTATKILTDLLVGQRVNIYQTKTEGIGRQNRMGHQIAHIERKKDKIWIQGTLLYLGVARARTERFNPEMSEQMYAVEEISRKEKNGLWKVEGFKIAQANNAELAIGDFQIVEGKIKSMAMRKNVLYLNFGDNWREDFTVSITSADRRLFAKKGLNPRDWSGGMIRVRGWVGSYYGPHIKVDHPEMIELLFDPKKQKKQLEKQQEETDKTDSALPKTNKPPSVNRLNN